MIQELRAIDAHAGGQTLRLLTDGVPRPLGRTMTARRDWMKRNADQLRSAVVLEPRGHADLTAAMLTEPASPGSHAGLILMDAHGYPAFAVHAVIATTTIAIERGLFFARESEDAAMTLVFDTVAGSVQAAARLEQRGTATRVDSVSVTGAPSFVHTASHPVRLGSRELRVDVAFGGLFHAIADTEAIGIPLTPARLPELRRLAVDLLESLNTGFTLEHPADGSRHRVAAVSFTGPPTDPEAHLRSVTVSADGIIDRSPAGTATSAIMAVLDAMGLLPPDQVFVHEGLAGSLLRGRILRHTEVGSLSAVTTDVSGTAWITAEHTLLLDDDDPYRDGLLI